MTKQEEYFKKIYCKDELPEENDTWYDTCSYRATGRYLHSLRGRGIDIPEYFYKPIPSQPVLSFEEWWNYTYPDICFIEKDTASMLFIREAYEAGCNQPPLEGDVKDAEKILRIEYDKLPNSCEEDWIAGKKEDMHKCILEAMKIYAKQFQSPKPKVEIIK